VEDLVSSLKVHEISLNEHEPAKKSKSITLPSKGKSSKALKVIESEEESLDGDSDEDPDGQEEQEVLEHKKWLQRHQERRSEGLLQLQEA